jgi:prepilin-type N-terminal cleavage/methylation domain-containing protein
MTSSRFSPSFPRRAFTLIELLVVIAIIAILSVVVVLTLNPAELLRQSRDSSRLSDMATMNSALGIYSEDVGNSMGTPSTTYISIPDPSATSTAGDQCQGLGLPAQSTSTGWAYQCAASSSYRNVNGTGWIPVNLSLIASGAPVGSLPQDPINQTSSNLFYTYTTDGKTFEVTAVMESQKYRSQFSANPPLTLYPGVDAVGTNLALSGFWNPSGLVGYWNFEEGSGSSTIDQSGNGNTGTWHGTPAGNNGTYYTGGKVGSYAGYFNGTNDYATTATFTSTGAQTFEVWVQAGATTAGFHGVMSTFPYQGADNMGIWQLGSQWYVQVEGIGGSNDITLTNGVTIGTWVQLAVTFDPNTSPRVKTYFNGNPDKTGNVAATAMTMRGIELGRYNNNNYWFGKLDDARVYNRAFSAAEIQALYNAQK